MCVCVYRAWKTSDVIGSYRHCIKLWLAWAFRVGVLVQGLRVWHSGHIWGGSGEEGGRDGVMSVYEWLQTPSRYRRDFLLWVHLISTRLEDAGDVLSWSKSSQWFWCEARRSWSGNRHFSSTVLCTFTCNGPSDCLQLWWSAVSDAWQDTQENNKCGGIVSRAGLRALLHVQLDWPGKAQCWRVVPKGAYGRGEGVLELWPWDESSCLNLLGGGEV